MQWRPAHESSRHALHAVIERTRADGLREQSVRVEKNSGIDRFGGESAAAVFCTNQWLTVQHTLRPLPFQPPRTATFFEVRPAGAVF
jgi:hypothetical protein